MENTAQARIQWSVSRIPQPGGSFVHQLLRTEKPCVPSPLGSSARVTRRGKELQEAGEQSGRTAVHELRNRVSSAFCILRGSRVTMCLEQCLPAPRCPFANFPFFSVGAFFFFL